MSRVRLGGVPPLPRRPGSPMSDRSRVVDALLWTGALIAIALAIAAGTRIVAWIVTGETEGIWRAALGLVATAGLGGTAIVHLAPRDRD
jgi:Mg/Co/Ni transporter MgtE